MNTNKTFPSCIVTILILTFIMSNNATQRDFRWNDVFFRTSALCNRYPSLNRKQKNLCHKFPDVTVTAMQGLEVGVEECQYQMRMHRWNCSTLNPHVPNSKSNIIFNYGFRESAIARALMSAGVVHTIWKACRSGSLLSCGCHSYQSQRDLSWSWAACEDEARFGAQFSRVLMDTNERTKDLRSTTSLHNNIVGRKAVVNRYQVRCKCHGMSGSCQMKTCWKVPPDFRSVGDWLGNKFNNAVKVELSNDGRRGDGILRKASSRGKRQRKPRTSDLIYYEKSPTFCWVDSSRDSWGTEGRECNKTSTNVDNCETLCCGRGYNVLQKNVTFKCNCRFKWCCHVNCEDCIQQKWVTTCK